MNDGKQLELVISLIEETFKDQENTEILKNHKLEDNSGTKREFDVVIKSSINGHLITIVVECKDYSKAVEAKEIEAFHSKCLRVPNISKKIFVSRKGYQRGAIASAKDFSIELFEADKLSSEDVFKWFPIKQLRLIKYQKYDHVVVICDLTEEELSKIDQNFNPKKSIINFDDGSSLSIEETLNEAISREVGMLWNLALLHWMRAQEDEKLNLISAPFQMKFSRPAELVHNDEVKISINGITATTYIRLEERDAVISDAREVVDSSGDVRARSIQVDMGTAGKGEIVIGNDRKAIFAEGEDGKRHKLDVLFSYDPKTDTLKKGPLND